MTWLRDLPKAVENNRPILLKLDFDPGIQHLSDQFAHQARIATQNPQRNTLLKQAGDNIFAFKSTAEFLKLIEKARNIDPDVTNRIHILSEFGQDPYDNFVIGNNDKKTVALQQRFHLCEKTHTLSASEKRQFLDDTNRVRRALSTPHLFFYEPRKEDNITYKDSNKLLLNKITEEGTGKKTEEPFIGLLAIHAKGEKLRGMIVTPQTKIKGNGEPVKYSAIISTPYIHREDFRKSFEEAQSGINTETKFGLIITPVLRQNQICTNIPESVLNNG